MVRAGEVEARAVRQNEVFDAALTFSRTEGIIPAPESAHAVRSAIIEAQNADEAGEERVILFLLPGHGHFDLAAYDAYLARWRRQGREGSRARRTAPRGAVRHPLR